MRHCEEDLVDIFPQHATTVSKIDVRRARRAHFLRQSLELEIVRALALAPDPRLVEQLDRTIALQQHFASAGDFTAFMAADKRELWALVQSRSGHIDGRRRLHLQTPGKAQDIVGHHKAIAQAIRAGWPDAAQDTLHQHLAGTLGYLDEIRARHPEFLSG